MKHNDYARTTQKLRDQVRDTRKIKHSSDRTVQSNVDWIEHFILFHLKLLPKEMGGLEIESFLDS